MNSDDVKRLAAAAIGAAALACAGESQASQTLYLDVDGCNGGCGASLYGEATVGGDSSSTVINIHLFDGYTFATDGKLNAAAFDVVGSPNLNDLVATPHFTAATPHTVQTIPEAPFGNFGYDVIWTGGGPAVSDLQFAISAGGSAVSLGSTLYNTIPLFLSVGVQHTVGGVVQEGYIGATTNLLTTAPEPASWALMLTGFGLTGAALRRRRRPAPLGV